MSDVRTAFIRIFFLGGILCHPLFIFSQQAVIDSTPATEQAVDTSDYIPNIYPSALEYNLMIAASKGYASEIERLISLGADINTETNEGATPLIFAVSNNMADAVRELLKHNPVIDKVTLGFETPLLIAAKNNNPEIAEMLIRAGADVDLTDRHGASPLHHASINGYLDLTDLLLYYDAAIDAKSDEGITPLMASIVAGFADVSDLLVQNGANMEARDNEGYTPFLYAALYGDTLIMDLLRKHGVDIYATNKLKHNALTLSILGNHPEATDYLLRIGDKWGDSGNGALSPYVVASKYSRPEYFSILKKHNVPGHIKYGIDQISVTASARFTTKDLYSGFSMSVKEPNLNAGLIAGCDLKFWYSRVLVKNSERLFYQYMDKSSVIYAGLFKDFSLSHNDRRSLSLSTSLLAGYSIGNKLKGTTITPENKFMVIPDVSIKLAGRHLALNAGLEYLKSPYYHIGPIWLRIGTTYTFFLDKVRTPVKTIKW